ncbi:MAG: hypothetical protein R2793_07885, partial [Flavobacteriaceae bacterium]
EDFEDRNTQVEEENNQEELTASGGSVPFLDWIFIGALIAAVVYLVYIFMNEGGTGLFSTKKNESITKEEELTVQNIEQTDIDRLIAGAEKDGNYRLAIRYYHMLVLKTLSLKNFIKLEEDKTNEEYFAEIRAQHFSKGFAYTTYLYDYIWYGEFPIDLRQYQLAKGNFVQLIKKVA